MGAGEKVYRFDGVESHDLINTLNKLGKDGWDFAGAVGHKLIMKRIIKEDE
jgi:hypothetical protein